MLQLRLAGGGGDLPPLTWRCLGRRRRSMTCAEQSLLTQLTQFCKNGREVSLRLGESSQNPNKPLCIYSPCLFLTSSPGSSSSSSHRRMDFKKENTTDLCSARLRSSGIPASTICFLVSSVLFTPNRKLIRPLENYGRVQF